MEDTGREPMEFPSIPQAKTTLTTARTARRRSRWRFAFPPVALLLYLLLIDAAIEAYLQALPHRWWVVGSVAGFLVLSSLLWRRTGWAMKAGTAALALVALLAFAASRTAEITGSLTLLRQAPPIATTVVIALLVALAGLSLIVVRAVPWWGKLFIGIITLYSTAAFVLPLCTAIAYPNLLDGGGFWNRLPFWLQGGFMGVLVLIPASLLVQLAAGIIHVRGRELWRWSFKVTALGLSLFLAFETFTLPMLATTVEVEPQRKAEISTETRPITGRAHHFVAAEPTLATVIEEQLRDRIGDHAASPTELPAEPPSTLTADRVAPALDALFDEAERLQRDLDRGRFDLDAVLTEIGTTEEAIFNWVRSNTRPLPYRGVLKGARGVLIDGAGNVLDRSLLLAELLRRTGHTVALANAQLTDSGSEIVEPQVLEQLTLGGARPARETADIRSLETETVEIDRLAAITGQDPAGLADYLRELERRGAVAQQVLTSQVRVQTEALVDTVEFERGGTSPLEEALESSTDHWWVVLTDTDPQRTLDLFQDQYEATMTARGLAGKPRLYALDELPESLYHTVTLSVTANQWRSNAVRSRKALSETFRVTEVQLQPMELFFVPSGGSQSIAELLGKEAKADPAIASVRDRVFADLDAQTAWTPVLQVGTKVYSKSMITADGLLSPAEELLGSGRALGSATSVLGPLGENLPPAAARQHLVGVTLEVELRSPAGKRTHTRTLFDYRDLADNFDVDTDLRRERASRFLSRQSFVVQVSEIPSTHLADLELDNILASRGAFERLITAAQGNDHERFFEELLQIQPPLDPAQQLAWLRLGGFETPSPVALVRANVLSSFEDLMLEGDVGRLVAGLDIIENEVLPLTLDADLSRRTNVYQGVLDTLLEDALFAFVPDRKNTAQHFGQDLANSTAMAWQSVPLTTGLKCYPEAAQVLDSERRSPSIRVVFSPDRLMKGSGEATFWRVDARTGSTLGYGSTGRGGVSAEQIVPFFNQGWTIFNAIRAGMACGEAAATGDFCQIRNCLMAKTFVAAGIGSGFPPLSRDVATKTVISAGILFKMLAGVTGAVARDMCES